MGKISLGVVAESLGVPPKEALARAARIGFRAAPVDATAGELDPGPELGEAVAQYSDNVLRNIKAKRVQCDEIWCFCYAKAKNLPPSSS